jgi:RNA polymerase sigma-70 factor, ECF subfamily
VTAGGPPGPGGGGAPGDDADVSQGGGAARYSGVGPTSSGAGFDRIFAAQYPALLRYLVRLTGDADAAEDAAQEAFVRLLRQQRIPESEVRPWLYTVATNLVRDAGRKAVRRRRILAASPRAREQPAAAETDMERAEAVAVVQAALARIPARDRQILLMREEGFRYDEIGRAAGVAASSVGTLIARALKRFAEAYAAVSKESGDPK